MSCVYRLARSTASTWKRLPRQPRVGRPGARLTPTKARARYAAHAPPGAEHRNSTEAADQANDLHERKRSAIEAALARAREKQPRASALADPVNPGASLTCSWNSAMLTAVPISPGKASRTEKNP